MEEWVPSYLWNDPNFVNWWNGAPDAERMTFIREQNKQFSPSFSTTKSEGQAPAQESKPEQTETKSQEQEQVAARGVDPPRFHR